MGRKTPPYEHWPEWTTSKFFSLLRTGLRTAFKRYPPKHAVLNNAKQRVPVLTEGGDQVHYKTGKRAGEPKYVFRYRCSGCGGLFPANSVETDHVIPAGSLTSYEDIVPFVKRLFCGVDGLQVLCKDKCHAEKTKEERKKK